MKVRGAAIVTGGVRGIGRAVALDLARAGWPVAVCYRRSADDAATLAHEAGEGAKVLAVAADVSDPAACTAFVERVRDELGPVAVLVNGAGPYHRVDVLEETPEGWREMIEANLGSVFYMARLVAGDMKRLGWGRIVSFAMANADRLAAQPMVTAHVIAKTGVLILTRTLARRLAPHGVTVNAVSPGFIASGSEDVDDPEAMLARIPAGRLGTVDDAVGVIRFLLSDEAAYVNGSNIHLSGGWGI